MEHDENEHRKPLTAGEMVRRGERLEELERPASEERQKELGKTHGTPTGKFPEGANKGDTRDKVGDALGVSGKTDEKAKIFAEKGIDALKTPKFDGPVRSEFFLVFTLAL